MILFFGIVVDIFEAFLYFYNIRNSIHVAIFKQDDTTYFLKIYSTSYLHDI